MILFTRELSLALREDVVHSGYVSEWGQHVIADNVTAQLMPGDMLSLTNRDGYLVSAVGHDGKIMVEKSHILHTSGDPLDVVVEEEHTIEFNGVHFMNADGEYVACFDENGYLRTGGRVIHAGTIEFEYPESGVMEVGQAARLTDARAYTIHGQDGGYPVFQAVTVGGACVFKIAQDGMIYTAGGLFVRKRSGTTAARRIFGSFTGAGL